jgi:xanthosine utilization system XapX-like protein
MALLFQIGAILTAGFVVALAWTARPGPPAIARSIVVIAVAFGYIAFWGHAWQNGKSFRAQRTQWRAVAQPAIVGAPAEPGFQAGFAEWIRSRLEPGDRFYLVPSPTRDEAVYQWFTYRLIPSLVTEKPEQADWLIFYGINPRETGLTHLIKGIAEQYGPGYSLARTQHAS